MGALPPFLYVVLALSSLVVAAGLLVWVAGYIRDARRGNSRGRERSPTGAAPAEPGAPAPAGERELLRVVRTERGRLIVWVQGQHYRHLREITDAQVGRETIEALRAVLAFAEGWLPAVRQPPPPPTSKEPTARASTGGREAFLERLRRGDLFSLSSPSRSSQPEPLILAEKINDMVQERLQKRPDLARRHVRLAPEADGTLRIYVGQQTFEAVADIPDTEVRTLIQDAIREWEKD